MLRIAGVVEQLQTIIPIGSLSLIQDLSLNLLQYLKFK
jgi:hypothetical protein